MNLENPPIQKILILTKGISCKNRRNQDLQNLKMNKMKIEIMPKANYSTLTANHNVMNGFIPKSLYPVNSDSDDSILNSIS